MGKGSPGKNKDTQNEYDAILCKLVLGEVERG